MRPEDAKDGMMVKGRGKVGELARQPNGWDVITHGERLQSVDLSEWEPQSGVADRPGPVRRSASARDDGNVGSD